VYQPDGKLREWALAAIATLATQGRAVGYCVVGALQDPRKDVLTIRNLFPDRIAMRLDEPEQTDTVLGDGSRDRGALADQISADPDLRAGIAYVRLEGNPDPVRVRAAWVSDEDFEAMCVQYAPSPPARLRQSRRCRMSVWGSEIRSRVVTCVSVTAGAVRRRCSTRGSVRRGLVSGGSGARRG